jgi:hypothetical protein
MPPNLSITSSTDLSEASPAPVEEYAQTRKLGRVKNQHSPGSVFSLARRISGEEAGSDEDDSSVASSGVEVIVSELENLTQVSDSSLQLTARECDESDIIFDTKADKIPGDELKDGMKNVLDSCQRQAVNRTCERKDLLSQVLSQVRTGGKPGIRADNEIPIEAAIMRLIPSQRNREAAIKGVTRAQTRHLYLQIVGGKVQGVYGLDRTALRKLFSLEQRGDFVTFSSVKRWFRLEGLGFKVVFGYQYRHADAFEL